MNQTPRKVVDISPARSREDVDVEALVAQYAPIGRQLRRKARLQRIGAAAAACVALIALVVWARWPRQPASMQPPAAAAVAAAPRESAGETTQQQEFAQERRRFATQSESLQQAIAQIAAERQALDEQRRQSERQQKLLTDALREIDVQRRAIDQQQAARLRDRRPEDAGLAALAKQRQLLEQQHKQFQTQVDLLARKTGDLNAQRQELERQHQAIEQQRKELQAIVEKLDKVTRNREEQRAGAAKPQQVAAALSSGHREVGDEVLANMRGGLQIGSKNYEIAVGISRSVSINGVEQLGSSLRLDGLTQGIGRGDVPQLQGALVQSGAGNVLAQNGITGAGSAATIIQNTLDNQLISTKTVVDVSLQNVGSLARSISAAQTAAQSINVPH
jgi:hypothetical protein